MISQSLLPEFDMETANTRKMLERVPDAAVAFTPHAKSMTLGRLGGHLAEIPVWAQMTLDRDVFDMRPNGKAEYSAYELTSTKAALAFFDENLAVARTLLAAMSEVKPHDAGLASGIVNTAFMLGGAIGLAVLASLAAVRSSVALARGGTGPLALLDGYQAAFWVAADRTLQGDNVSARLRCRLDDNLRRTR